MHKTNNLWSSEQDSAALHANKDCKPVWGCGHRGTKPQATEITTQSNTSMTVPRLVLSVLRSLPQCTDKMVRVQGRKKN